MVKKKSRDTKQNQSNRLFFMAAAFVAVAAVIVGVGIFLASRPTTPTIQKITSAQYQQQFANATTPYLLIDVRTPDEFASGHIAGAINIDLQTLPDRLNEVPRDKPVVVYCHSGNRSAQAASVLNKAGYAQVYDLLGGITAWTGAGLPIVQ